MQNAPTIFRSRAEQAIEAKTGTPVPELLRELYEEQRLTQQAIADHFQSLGVGVALMTVQRWMRKYGISTGYPTGTARKRAA